MRRRHLELLRSAAEHRLDLQKRAVLEQSAAVEVLEGALARLAGEVEKECRIADLATENLPALLDYLADCRQRSAHLDEDLTTARSELESRAEQARSLYLEGRRYERLIELSARAEERVRSRRERRFLDWLGERRHNPS
jgi:hypothetical protein